jgi:organic radical activating enzyme
LKQDLDLLSSKIDTLLLLRISGGEPFTYPHLSEFIEHIASA